MLEGHGLRQCSVRGTWEYSLRQCSVRGTWEYSLRGSVECQENSLRGWSDVVASTFAGMAVLEEHFEGSRQALAPGLTNLLLQG